MPETSVKYIFRFIFTVLAFLMTVSLNGQKNDESPPRKKLTLADYKGVVDETVPYLANTHSVVSLEYAPAGPCKPGKVTLKVMTKISVSESSWMKLSEIKSREYLAALLSHEQGHYDLEEIFSIDLKRTLLNNCFDKNTVTKQVDSIYTTMHARYNTLQRRYDTETEYMMDKDMQSKWKQKIAVMFKEIQQ